MYRAIDADINVDSDDNGYIFAQWKIFSDKARTSLVVYLSVFLVTVCNLTVCVQNLTMLITCLLNC